MNKMNIFKAIDLIDDDLIREADISSETSSNLITEDESAITVSGVEVHSGIRWQRIAALASAFILVAGLGAVGALLHKHRPPRQIKPSEVMIPAATEITSETDDKQTESSEAATKKEKDKEKETKESTNTAPTTKANEEKKPAAVNSQADNDELPANVENNAPDEKPTELNTEPQKTISAPTTQKPVTTAQTTTTIVKTTVPKVTEPTSTTEPWVIHLPCTKESDIAWNAYECPEMFEILRSIQYRQITAAEFAVTDYEAPNTYLIDSNDNNRVYALNFEHKWVMRYGTDGTDCGDAPMPDRLYELFCGS